MHELHVHVKMPDFIATKKVRVHTFLNYIQANIAFTIHFIESYGKLIFYTYFFEKCP